MATRSFSLTTLVPVAPERAIDFLLALDAHSGMHPYLEVAEVVAEGDGADGPWQEWRVVERPALGPLRYRIRFPARMVRLGPTVMRGDVRAAPGCVLSTSTTAIATAEGTRVDERTVVTAPAPLVGYMAKHAQLAHARTFSLLPAELARQA